MKKAVIYARYSSDKQTEQSIEGQLRVCTEYCESKDIVIVGTYIDRAITGTNVSNRKEFQKMILDSAEKNFDYVIVYKLDRFARNREDSIINKAVLKKNGVLVLSATEGISDNPEGIILEGLLEAMAEYYSKELAQKVKRGMRESRTKGYYTGGEIPFGYVKNGKKLVIDEVEASIVRRVFDEYDKGYKIIDIVEGLAKDKILNKKGRPFSVSRISDMLRSLKYTGIHIVDGEVFPNIYPRIISDGLFDSVQSKLKGLKNKGFGYKKVDPFLLTGKLKCGYCGALYRGNSGTSKTKVVKYYYKCRSRIEGTCKDSKIYRKHELEDLVFNGVIEKITNTKTFTGIAQRVVDLYNKEILVNTDLLAAKKRLQGIESKLDNYSKAISMGIFNEKTQKDMNDLIYEKAVVEKEISILEAVTERPIDISVIKEYMSKVLMVTYDSFEDRKLLFSKVIDEVLIKGNDIIITCNLLEDDLNRNKKELSLAEEFAIVMNGAASRSRTRNLLVRSQTLYPVEL